MFVCAFLAATCAENATQPNATQKAPLVSGQDACWDGWDAGRNTHTLRNFGILILKPTI